MTLVWIVVALNVGFVLGAWWASRPKDTPTDWCVQHDSPMTDDLCDHAERMLAEGRFAGVICISANGTALRRIK